MDTRVSKDKSKCIVRCQDNNVVNVANTFVGIGDKDKVKDCNKNEKKYIEVDRPETIRHYNNCIGDVGLMDRLTSYYPTTFRTKRWPTRVILDLFIVSVVKAWIENRGWERKKGMKRNHILDLISFRKEFDQALCKAELSPNRVR